MDKKSIQRIEATFAEYCYGFDLYLHDHRSGETYRGGDDSRYPITSCYKLAVLIALFRKLEQSPSLVTEKLAVGGDTDFHGASLLAGLIGSVEMTVIQLAQVMLAVSDGLATDVLVGWIGRSEVKKVLAELCPDSSLPISLSSMVAGIQSLTYAKSVKTDSYSSGQATQILADASAFGFTNARDLATLASAVYPPKKIGEGRRAAYLQTLATKRIFLRCEMFFGETVKCYAKSGSMLMRYFMNDCGVIVDTQSESRIASFAYCSHGWRLPAFTCESIGGMIGLEVARAFGLDPVPNMDWSSVGEKFLMPTTD